MRASYALYGPTACGKTAVAEALMTRLGGEAVSADSAALYAGIPIVTAAPGYPTRLVGEIPLDQDVSVGEYQNLAHGAIDAIRARGVTPVVVGGTGLYLRAALSSLTIPPPPPPGARERWERVYDEEGAEAAHALLVTRDPTAGAKVHANDRRRVIRALELNELGSSLVPPINRLWESEFRHPTVLIGLDLPIETLDRNIALRVSEMVGRGVVEEARSAWAGPLSGTARKVLGLEQFATLPEPEAVEAVIAATRRLARYQRKWLRRLPVTATLDADRPPEELADDIVSMAGAGQRLPDH